MIYLFGNITRDTKRHINAFINVSTCTDSSM